MVQPDGIVTDWLIESVCVVPYPSIHASQVPPWAGSLGPFCPMTAGVEDHTVAPDSKPGLPSFWPGLAQPPPCGLTVQENDVLPDWVPLVAVTVTVDVPAVVGVPLITPVDEFTSDVRFMVYIGRTPHKERVAGPEKARAKADEFGREVIRQFEQDIEIWRHQRYSDPPALATDEYEGFTAIRKWAKQFYPEASVSQEGPRQ